jgi:hypothetical protein
MTKRELLIRKIEKAPDPLLDELLGFLQLLQEPPRQEAMEPAYASEAVLGRDWLRPEEDEAWCWRASSKKSSRA